MNRIILSKGRVARIWLDDAPMHSNFNSLVIAGANQKKRNAAHLRCQKVKVELLLPLGGRFLYGLLGCELSLYDQTRQRIELQIQNGKSILTNSLAQSIDIVHSGLPEEFENSVLDEAGACLSKLDVESEFSVSFYDAAYGEIGSSISIFRRLCRIAISVIIMLNNSDSASFDDIKSILEEN